MPDGASFHASAGETFFPVHPKPLKIWAGANAPFFRSVLVSVKAVSCARNGAANIAGARRIRSAVSNRIRNRFRSVVIKPGSILCGSIARLSQRAMPFQPDTDPSASSAPTGAWANATVRDLPELPSNTWRIIGPGIVAAGVGLSSGEFILWPFIASQVGLVFFWAAVVGVVTQFFLNMEIERYTLATGETAHHRIQPPVEALGTGHRHHGLLRQPLARLGAEFGDAATYLFGGDARPSRSALLVIGAALTLAPVVYVALERLIFVKVAAVITLAVLAIVSGVTAHSWRALPGGLFNIGYFPPELSFALLFGAMVFAGAGGGQNLCQSNWIRDKGFGMGSTCRGS